MCCGCCSVRQQKIWVFTIGTILTVVGIILIAAWPTWSDRLIESMLPLTPNSFIYDLWVVTPMPIYISVYLYNWTNPHQVRDSGVKPNFVQMGPYTFRDHKVKVDLDWDDVNNTVTFYGLRTWWFVPEKSGGSLDDLVTTPHFPSVSASKITRNMHPILRKIVNYGLNREGGNLTMTHTAREWVFDGFYDDLLDFVERLHSPLLPLYTNNFGWFYERNNSKEAEGSFTVHTGKGDLSQLGDLKKWNGSDHTGYWEGECGKVNGSTGELWTPGKKWDDPLSIFIFDAKRYLNLFAKREETFAGIKARRYETTDQTFDSGHIAPDTKCFCVRNRPCPMNGAVDYSPVTFRAPIFMSHRHFYMADPMYRENTTGLNPDPEEHSMYVLLEPKFGIPLQVKGQVLASILVERNDHIDLLRNISYDFYAPLCEIKMEADIDDDLLKTVQFIMNISLIGQSIGIGLLVIGVIMIIVGIYVTKTHKWRGEMYPNKNPEAPVDKSQEKAKEMQTENENQETMKKEDTPSKSHQTELKTSEVTENKLDDKEESSVNLSRTEKHKDN